MLLYFFGLIYLLQAPACTSVAALVLTPLVLAFLIMLGGVTSPNNLDYTSANAPLLAFCAVPLLLFLLFTSWGALTLLVVLELSGMCFAIFAVSSQTHYDHYAINALFWASEISCFLITIGISLLLNFNGATLIAQLPYMQGTELRWACAPALVLIISGIFIKIGIQP
jgi:hypothetical protein